MGKTSVVLDYLTRDNMEEVKTDTQQIFRKHSFTSFINGGVH